MITVKDVYNVINRIAPFEYAEKWDNCGLLAGDMNQQVKKIMLALDVTDWVIAEAIEQKVDLLITHHPAYFEAFNKVTAPSKAYQLVSDKIGLISAHTNLDIAQGGINDVLADLLGLQNVSGLNKVRSKNYYKVITFAPATHAQKVFEAMADAGAGTLGDYKGCAYFSNGEGTFIPCDGANPFTGTKGVSEKVNETKVEMICAPSVVQSVLDAMKKAHPYEEPAYDIFENSGVKQELYLGKVGFLKQPCHVKQFALLVKKALNLEDICLVDGQKEIKKVAVCSGAGSSCMSYVIASGADAFVTGELKYAEALVAKEQGITVAIAGHFETENIILKKIEILLRDSFVNLDIIISQSHKSPVEYY